MAQSKVKSEAYGVDELPSLPYNPEEMNNLYEVSGKLYLGTLSREGNIEPEKFEKQFGYELSDLPTEEAVFDKIVEDRE